MADTDSNEVYEVVPIALTGRGPPNNWWTVRRNGVPVRHFPDKEMAERFATDPGYRTMVARKKEKTE
jgi:hypothetical protein